MKLRFFIAIFLVIQCSLFLFWFHDYGLDFFDIMVLSQYVFGYIIFEMYWKFTERVSKNNKEIEANFETLKKTIEEKEELRVKAEIYIATLNVILLKIAQSVVLDGNVNKEDLKTIIKSNCPESSFKRLPNSIKDSLFGNKTWI